MSKIRTIKPELFRHERLFEVEQSYQLPLRLAFAGLFTCCDREGRFRWRPRQLKLDILPYDEVDFAAVLNALHTEGFIQRYQHENEVYGYIPSWHRHQTVNTREPASRLPDPQNCQHLAVDKPITINATIITSIKSPPAESQSVMDAYVSAAVNTTVVSIPDPVPAHVMHVQEHASHVQPSAAQMHASLEVEMEGKGKGNGKEVCAEIPANLASTESSLTDIIIPLQDHTEFIITSAMVEEWQATYPTISVLQALRHIRSWNLANPKRRKTRQGILKHITNWLIREQQNGGSSSRSPPTPIYSRSNALQNHNLTVAEQWLQRQPDVVINGSKYYDT